MEFFREWFLLKKDNQNKPKASRKKEIIKTGRNQWNWKQENNRKMKPKADSLKKVNKIDKPLARLTHTQKKEAQNHQYQEQSRS